MNFNRRHYEFLAENIRNKNQISRDNAKWIGVVLGEWFRVLANFNSATWHKACGVSEDDIRRIMSNVNKDTKEIPIARRNKTP